MNRNRLARPAGDEDQSTSGQIVFNQPGALALCRRPRYPLFSSTHLKGALVTEPPEEKSRRSVPSGSGIPRLKAIVDRLRSPGGCPWDLEQTPETLKPFLLEEAHEVAEAIESGNPTDLRDELGDLVMNIFLQARLGEETGTFTLEELADSISEKLIRRHPHVFGNVHVHDSDQVRKNWEEIKKREKGTSEADESVIRTLPASLPALSRAMRVGQMAAEVGFDWPDSIGPLKKIAEELEEVRAAHKTADTEEVSAEVGDLLFAITSFCRKTEIDPEQALKNALDRFTGRFRTIEKQLKDSDDHSLPVLDTLWEQAKRMHEPGSSSDSR